MSIDLTNTEIAFRSQSTAELRKSQLLFKAFGSQALVQTGPRLVTLALKLHLPVTPLIKKTLFEQFCGGEDIEDCLSTMRELKKFGIGTILDYSVEGRKDEASFDKTVEEVARTIEVASREEAIPFSVFKPTGVARFGLLEKVQTNASLAKAEQEERERVEARFEKLCGLAAERGVRLMIDAEESWIQDGVDELVARMMARFNRERPIVYQTVQLYRKDRFAYLQGLAERAEREGFLLGLKLVRGAYMEKERERASRLGYPSPIHDDKTSVDRDYDKALAFCVDRLDRISICAGTHNEASVKWLAELMESKKIAPQDERVYFSQLLGMGEHLSYNLAHHGFNVAKYVPYGPVKDVLPYLFRRAEENSSIKGQASRELVLIERELQRRRAH